MKLTSIMAQPFALQSRRAMRLNTRGLSSSLRLTTLAMTFFGILAAGPFSPAAAKPTPSPTAAPTPNLVYVANNGGGNISGYTENPASGILNATAAVFSGHAPSQVVVVTTNSNGQMNNFVYATNSADNTISGFSLNLLNGVLTPLAGTDSNPFPVPLPAGSNPNGIVQAASGGFLYVSNTGSNSISEFAIDPASGTLTPTTEASASTGNSPGAMTVISAGPLNFLYVIDSGDRKVEAFSIDTTTGALTAVGSYSVGPSPVGIVANALDTFVYVTNSGDGTITEFTTNVDGSLTTQGSLGGLNSPQGIGINGSHLWVAEAGNNNIAELQIASQTSGTLQFDGEAAAGASPAWIAVAGSHVYASNMGDNTISQYSADAQSGLLTPLSPATVPSGAGPNGIVANSTNLYVFAANRGESTLTPYSIGVSGTLTPVDLAKAGNGVTGVAIDSTAKFVYATNSLDNTITVFAIDPSSGAPIPVGLAPEANGSSPEAIAASPTQPLIYVVNNAANTLASFKIGSGGALASVMPIATGTGPTAIAVDLTGSFAYVTNSTGSVSEFALASDGTMSSIGSAAAGDDPVGIALAPGGSFAYVINSVDKTIEEYTRAGDGTLTPSGNTFATGTSPAGIAITPSGRFLYVTNNGDKTISAYQVNSDGTLTAVSGGTAATGNSPKDLVIDPTGRFVYVTNNSLDKTISEYSINGDGTLTPLTTIGTGSSPEGIAISGTSTPPPPPVTSTVRVTPAQLKFPRTRVGKTSGAKSVVVRNTAKKGGSPVTFVGISSSRTEFQIRATTCMGTLPAGKACKIKLTFTPSDLGPVTGTLTIQDNAQNGSQSVPLSGTGTQPRK
jgi:6-phosphogluconolactonase (cycloisomerase 2 family)